jgi:hypothetical protein
MAPSAIQTSPPRACKAAAAAPPKKASAPLKKINEIFPTLGKAERQNNQGANEWAEHNRAIAELQHNPAPPPPPPKPSKRCARSHINQAYNRFVPKSDKAMQQQALTWLQQDKLPNASHIDQWNLVHTALASVRHFCNNPSIWSRSFKVTNTCPSMRRSFKEFIQEIQPHLYASDSYELRELATDG